MKADFTINTHYHKNGRHVLPSNAVAYILIIDKDRKHPRVKHFILKRLLVIAESLAN